MPGLSLSDTDQVALTGASLPSIPVSVSVRAGFTLEATRHSTCTIGNMTGLARATHSSGAQKTSAFSLNAFFRISLRLAREWSLALVGAGPQNNVGTTFGLAATAFAGIGLGLFCGDTSNPDDNVRYDETYGDARTAPLNVFHFDKSLAFGTKLASLGTISVFDDMPVPPTVPLPAGMPVLFSGMDTLLVLHRRSNNAVT